MEIDNETSNNLKISFSAKFMLDALKMFDDEEIYLLLNGEISPIILKKLNSDEMIQLILPMKTY
jgi:DNA polymerase-3 subunit beta